MPGIVRISLLCLTIASPFLLSNSALAKKPEGPSAAPIPIQITTARKVFISYREGDADPGAPNLTYNEFYALLKAWGKFELVRAPLDADLVFEIRYISGITDAQLVVTIVDPKTHIVLWPFVQHVEHSSRESAHRKKFDEAMEDLIGDIQKLTSQDPGQ
jgi:hypothetical protein